jgi:hypothetical protein
MGDEIETKSKKNGQERFYDDRNFVFCRVVVVLRSSKCGLGEHCLNFKCCECMLIVLPYFSHSCTPGMYTFLRGGVQEYEKK